MSSLLAKVFVALQYLLPRYQMTALVRWLSRVRHTGTKNFLIERFVAAYDVDVAEVAARVPDDFATFNAFFTRALDAGARRVDPDPAALIAPVDGTVSAIGNIRHDQILQAKGKDYALHDLLATNVADADRFLDGSFATIYLAPYNYHRVHTPLAGELTALHYVPGDLFSVNAVTVDGVQGLFCRNERLVCHLSTAVGPMALVMVGALNVGSISTPWTGEIRPTRRGVGAELPLGGGADRQLEKGDLLGWFNMGSTVIVLLPDESVAWDEALTRGISCRFGERLGQLRMPI